MKTLPSVWFPTCEEVARHCLDHFPPRATSARR
jgi:peptidoglycan-N-acetylglucosamine deacetylase